MRHLKHYSLPPIKQVFWAVKARGPSSDLDIQRFCWPRYKTKGPTLRGARKKLERAGILEQRGFTSDGRKIWELRGMKRAAVTRPAPQRQLALGEV